MSPEVVVVATTVLEHGQERIRLSWVRDGRLSFMTMSQDEAQILGKELLQQVEHMALRRLHAASTTNVVNL